MHPIDQRGAAAGVGTYHASSLDALGVAGIHRAQQGPLQQSATVDSVLNESCQPRNDTLRVSDSRQLPSEQYISSSYPPVFTPTGSSIQTVENHRNSSTTSAPLTNGVERPTKAPRSYHLLRRRLSPSASPLPETTVPSSLRGAYDAFQCDVGDGNRQPQIADVPVSRGRTGPLKREHEGSGLEEVVKRFKQ
ncbi:hypothetical protein DL93DRAFT_2088129 [Clavulina sp. PMI_390]|nr:hypothetical protein DL93DRAFT_2088129 [Clavulina sp. PMI_390]